MKISDIHVHRVFLPLKQTWDVGQSKVPGKHHVLVCVQDDEGRTGYGTVAPLPQFSGETGSGAYTVIQELLRPALLGMDPFDIEGIMQTMDGVITQNHLAKSAVDMAIYDLLGKRLSLPVHRLLGGCVRKTIPLCWVVACSDHQKAVEEAVQKVQEGYRCIKLKIGTTPEKTLQRLKSVRSAIGPAIKMRIDFNQQFTVDECIRLVHKAEEIDLEYIEQPAPKWDLDALAKVNRSVSVPVMVDEGVFSYHDVIGVIKKQAASIVNLKIGKIGGLYNAKKTAAICEAAGMTCMIGCMLENGIAMLAGAHLAAAAAPITHACELIGNQLYHEDFIDMTPFYANGQLRVPTTDGLGFSSLTQSL